MVNKLELYKEWYFKEIEKKKSLDDGLTFPFGIISALFAVWFFFATKYDYQTCCCTWWLFIIFMGLFFLLMAIATFFLLKSYVNPFKSYKYSNLPSPMQIEEYYDKSIAELKATNKPDGLIGKESEVADEELEENLIKMYSDAVSNDMPENRRRLDNLYFGKLVLYCCAVALLVTSICFGHNYYMKGITGNVYKVQVINPK
jgi:hypothetical protein